jgi:hypothetical protein
MPVVRFVEKLQWDSLRNLEAEDDEKVHEIRRTS